MPIDTRERAATAAELAAMQALLASAPTPAIRFRRGVENALVLWAVSLLAIAAAWLALGWLLGKVLAVDLGLRSSATAWVLGLATPACAAFAIASSVRWARHAFDGVSRLRVDLARSRVTEERYTFTAARRFQEPEHRGLIYFLREAGGQVFAVYDRESQDLGLRGEDPLGSRFRPLSALTLVRAPGSRFVVGRNASGDILDAGTPIAMLAGPAAWPEDEECCGIPWDRLEARWGGDAATDAAP